MWQPPHRSALTPRRGAAACRGAATPGQRPRWRPWRRLPQACADAPSPIPATTACVPAPTARSGRRRAGANRPLRSRATHPAAMQEAAASVPLPAAVRSGATGWARPVNGSTGQVPASERPRQPAGDRPTSLLISSAPAPSNTPGPVPEGCHAPSRSPWPDACPSLLPCPLRQGLVPTPAHRTYRRARPGNHRLRSTRGSRRARYLRSLGSNHPRANPVQRHGRRRSGGVGAASSPCRGSPLNQVCEADSRIGARTFSHEPGANRTPCPQNIGTVCTGRCASQPL